MNASDFGGIGKNGKSNTMEKFLPENFYSRIACGEINRIFYPVFSDRKAWNAVARSGFKLALKKSLTAKSDEILNQTFEALSAYNYFRFILEGDRARFEQAYFRRRNNLAALVMTMCLTGDREKYLPAIIDHLGAIMAEPYWCGHSHAPHDSDPMPIRQTAQWVDLFASETAVTVALTLQILRDEILSVSPRFYHFCKEETLKKTVLPILENFELGIGCWWVNATNNWTVWCSANILLAGAVLLDDSLQLADLTRKLNRSVSGFFDSYSEDGYCDEGPGYWTKAAVQMFFYCRTLNDMIPGCIQGIFRDPKFRKMGDFGAMMVISGRDHVISADCGHVSNDGIHAGPLYDFGNAIKSDPLRSFALNRMQTDPRRRPVLPAEAAVCRFGSGNHLASLLDSFFKMPSDPEKIQRAKLPPVSFWPGRMGIIRHENGFSAALKGGHNDEMHNHNDLGHFTLYYAGKPLVIDLGTGMYSRKNFSPDRYQLFYTSAIGHNALCFGKQIQQPGREFEAGLVMLNPTTLVADLSQAYPAEAGIRKYVRTLRCGKTQAVVEDSIERKKKGTATSTLYSPVEVKKSADSKLLFGNNVQCTLKNAVCTAIEPVPLEEIPRHWGSRLWKITLKTTAPKSEFIFEPDSKRSRSHG